MNNKSRKMIFGSLLSFTAIFLMSSCMKFPKGDNIGLFFLALGGSDPTTPTEISDRYYSFTSGSLSDHNGKNALTAVGAPSGIFYGKDGEATGAYYLNGTSQYLSGTVAGLPTGSSPRTLCTFVSPSAHPASGAGGFLIGGYGSQSTGQAFGLFLSNNGGTQQVHIAGYNDNVTISYAVPLNSWSHLCATYNGTTAELYINGQLQSSQLKTYNTGTSFFSIGGDSNLGLPLFQGKIDEFRIYTQVLSATEIRQLSIQVPSGLVAYYDFNGDTKDMSGSGRDGTISGTVTAVPDRFGVANSAYKVVNALANKITASDSGLPMFNQARSLCAWYRSENAYAGITTFMGYGNQGTNGEVIGVWLSGPTSPSSWGFVADVNGMAPIHDLVWRHICITNDGANTGYVYVNGTQVGTGAQTLGTTSTGSLFIGNWVVGREYTGSFDDVRVYNRALSLNEVRALSGYHPIQVSSWNTTPAVSSLGFHVTADAFSNQSDSTVAGTWPDMSGSNFNATPTGPPTYRSGANGLNGRPTLQFGGTQYFDAGNTTMSFSGLTTFTVGQNNVTDGTYRPFFSKDGACAASRINLHKDGPGLTNYYLEDASVNAVVPGTMDESVILTSMLQNASLLSLYKNGSTPATIASSNSISGTTNCALQIGARTSGANFFIGRVSEQLIFKQPLTTNSSYGSNWTDREIVECFLSTKYGISLAHSCP